MQIITQYFSNNIFNRCAHFTGHQFVFGLAAELGLWYFDRQNTTKTFTHIVAGYFNLGFFGELVFFNVFINHAGHGCAQSSQMRTAVTLWNIIGETQHTLVIAVIPLHGYFNTNVCTRNAAIRIGRPFTHGVKHIGMQSFFTRVDKFNKTFDTTGT